MFDLVIKKGLIVDGSGEKACRADIGIVGEKIEKIGDLTASAAKRDIDAAGLVVSPGFIDMHSHSDLIFSAVPFAEPKLMQGITTEAVGNCGLSVAPVEETKLALLQKYLAPFQGGTADLSWDWKSFGDYLDNLRGIGTAVNLVPFVGQGTVRIAVMGFENRPATSSEMGEMKSLVEEAIEQGAFGISAGLIYPPGVYTPVSELIELYKAVAQKGKICVSHIRSEGYGLVESIKEIIKIGRQTSMPVHVSHLKAMGKDNWGKTKDILALMEKERQEEGLDITYDQYPYVACSTYLTALLPPWVHQGGVEKLLGRLKDPKLRKKIEIEMQDSYLGWENILRGAGGWHNILLNYCGKRSRLEGKSIQVIAEEENKDPYELFFDLLIKEEANVIMTAFVMDEQDIERILKDPYAMIGTDGISTKGKPHPRLYGTFPRVLSRYVRENKTLSLEEAIRKMTALPAKKLKLEGRGFVRENMYADLVVFSAGKIRDLATYDHPRRYPQGIEYVLINGKIAVEKGVHKKSLFGKVLLSHGNGSS